MQIHRIKDRLHKIIDNMTTIETNKKTNKQANNQTKANSSNESRVCNRHMHMHMHCSNSKLRKNLLNFDSVSVRALKTVKCLPEILFNFSIMDHEELLANIKISKPINA